MASLANNEKGTKTGHQHLYKQGISKHVESSMERRKQATIQIRRSKKKKAMMAKRMKYTQYKNNTNNNNNNNNNNSASNDVNMNLDNTNKNTNVTEIVSRLVNADTIAKATSALKTLRRKLSTNALNTSSDENYLSPILLEFVTINGSVDILLKYLKEGNDEQQLEATWCLTNLAGGTHDMARLVIPAVPYFIAFVSGTSKPLQEQALWALGNIAGDSQEFRNQLFVNGAIKPIIDLFGRSKTPEIVKNAAWTLSNLCRGTEILGMPFIENGILEPLLSKLKLDTTTSINGPISSNNNNNSNIQLVIECMWIATFLTAKEENSVQILVNSGLLHHLIPHIRCKDFRLLTPLIRSLGNILSINNCPSTWLDVFLNDTFFTPFMEILNSNNNRVGGGGFSGPYNRALLKEAAWVTSSMMADATEQQKQILSNIGVVNALMQLMKTAIFNTRQEAACALFNYIADENQNRVHEVLFQDTSILKCFVEMLNQPNAEAAHFALNVVHIALTQNGGPQTVESVGGMEALDDIVYNSQGIDIHLQERASKLSDEFYGNNYGETPDSTTSDFNVSMNYDYDRAWSFKGINANDNSGAFNFGNNNNNNTNTGSNTNVAPSSNNNDQGRGNRGRRLSNQPAWMTQ